MALNFVSILAEIEKNEMDGACSTYEGEERLIQGFGGGKRQLGGPRGRWGILLSWIFRKWDVGLWTGSSWLRIRTGRGHLSMR